MVSVPTVVLVTVNAAWPAPSVTGLAVWPALGPVSTLKLTVVPGSGFPDPSSTVAVTVWETPVPALCEVGASVIDGGPGGGGEVDPVTWTWSNAAVVSSPMLCDVTNRPI